MMSSARTLARILREGFGALVEHVVLHPFVERVALARDLIPLLVEAVVARVIALRIGRERAARHLDHMTDGPVRQHHGVAAAFGEFVDALLDRHDLALGGELRRLLIAEYALDHDVALAVGALRMDHGDVRPVRRDRGELLPGERAHDRFDIRTDLRQVGADVAAEDGERKTRRAGLIGVCHRGVRVLLDFDLVRPALLGRLAEAMQRADAGVAAPGDDEPVDAAHADHLIVNQIRRHTDERQMLAALPDDLVYGRLLYEISAGWERGSG